MLTIFAVKQPLLVMALTAAACEAHIHVVVQYELLLLWSACLLLHGLFVDVLIVSGWCTVVIAGYQERKGHYRPSAPVWDTWLIHQCIIKHGSARSPCQHNDQIYWSKWVDGPGSGIMCRCYGVGGGRKKINVVQYQRPIGSNILCGKQIQPNSTSSMNF